MARSGFHDFMDEVRDTFGLDYAEALDVYRELRGEGITPDADTVGEVPDLILSFIEFDEDGGEFEDMYGEDAQYMDVNEELDDGDFDLWDEVWFDDGFEIEFSVEVTYKEDT